MATYPPPMAGVIDVSPQLMGMRTGTGRPFSSLVPLNEVSGIVIHHTGARGDIGSILSTFGQRGVVSQFVMDRNGQVYQTLPTGMSGWQIATGHDPYYSNHNTIGIELIANDDSDVTAAQKAALPNWFAGLKSDPNWGAQNITSDYVFGHGQLDKINKEPTEGQSGVAAIQAAFPPTGTATPKSAALVMTGQAAKDPNLSPQAGAYLQAVLDAAPGLGINSVDITAGQSSTHKSHFTGSQFDIRPVAGETWTPEQRAGLAAAARAAGADRFGFYTDGSLHIGASGDVMPNGRKLQPGVWDQSTNFVGQIGSPNIKVGQLDPAAQAFAKSYYSGEPMVAQTSGATGGLSYTGTAELNNPGNMRASDDAKAQPGYMGEAYKKDANGNDRTDIGKFAVYDTPEHGAAAMNAHLDFYAKNGLNTINGIVNQWAPASDANQPNSYASYLSTKLGIPPDQPLGPENRAALMSAMASLEQGHPISFTAAPMQTPEEGAATAMAIGMPMPPSPTMASAPPPTIKPTTASDVPLGPLGAPDATKAMLPGYDASGAIVPPIPATITDRWNTMLNNIAKGGEAAKQSVTDYLNSAAVAPAQRAVATELAWNPAAATAIPKSFFGFPVRDPVVSGAGDLLTVGHAADQWAKAAPSDATWSAPTMVPTDTTSDTSIVKPISVSSGGQGEVPQSVTWGSMAKAGQDALQAVNAAEAVPTGSMASTPPAMTYPNLTESMNYALHPPVGVTDMADMTSIAPAPVAAPMAYAPVGGAGVAPRPSIATRAPSVQTITGTPSRQPSFMNRLFGSPDMQSYPGATPVDAGFRSMVASLIGSGSSPFTPAGSNWHSPDFNPHSGGSTYAWTADPNDPGHGHYVNSYGQTLHF